MTANSHPPSLENIEGELTAAETSTEGRSANSTGTDTPCEHCGEQVGLNDSWCRHCGYYPRLGRCIDLADWEQHYDNGEYIGPAEAPISIWQGIPTWAWKLAAVLVGVTVVTVLAAILIPEETPWRTNWAISQVGLGLFAFTAVHLRVAIGALNRDRTLGILDVVTSPIRIWLEIITDFPRSFRVVATAVGGLLAVILAHAMIGVPYSELINLDAEPRPKKKTSSVIGAVTKMATSDGKNRSLEEAMEEFAGNAGANELAAKDQSEDDDEQPLVTRELNCLVVGWTPAEGDGGEIGSLVLAVKMNRRWRVIGNVSDGLTTDIQRQLRERVGSLSSSRPAVKCNQSANWLKPKLHVKIEVKYSEEDEQPTSMRFLEIL